MNATEYDQLHVNQQKRKNTINYNRACELKKLLPPNLRHKLLPYNWPKSFDPELIDAINKHEQDTWKRALHNIANTRHQAIVDDLARIDFKISQHKEIEHIDIQLKEQIHDIINHPAIFEETKARYMQFIASYTFTPKANTSTLNKQSNTSKTNINLPTPVNIASTIRQETTPHVPNPLQDDPISPAPLRSSMKRQRTSMPSPNPTIPIIPNAPGVTTSQLTIQMNQLTTMFQSLITKVDNLELKTSRSSSRSSSPLSTRSNKTNPAQQPQRVQPYQHNAHYQHYYPSYPIGQPPPPPHPRSPYPQEYVPPQMQTHYYPNGQQVYQQPISNNNTRKVHYN